MGVMNGTQRVEVLLVKLMLMTVMRVKSRVQRCLNSKYYFAPLGVTTEWLAGRPEGAKL